MPRLAIAAGELLRRRKKSLSVAESCTGGLLGSLITEVPGSSDYFYGGMICYRDEIKRKLLKVPASDLKKHGAVSELVAEKMAQGVRRSFRSDLGLAITGIAGPGGGSQEKPVGLVYIALASAHKTVNRRFKFSGNRRTIREQSAAKALALLFSFFS